MTADHDANYRAEANYRAIVLGAKANHVSDAALGQLVRQWVLPEPDDHEPETPPNVIDLIGWLDSHKPQRPRGT